MPFRPRLALTIGDPRGIGPEIVRAAMHDPVVRAACEMTVIGPTGAGVEVDDAVGAWHLGDTMAHAGMLSGRAVERAVELTRAGATHGIVTGPIDKAALLASGYNFAGHTELLSALTGASVAMMLASDALRVVLVTTHVPLRDVPRLVTEDAIIRVAAIARRGLREWFGLPEARLALCALNPHGGDGGRFGDEDTLVLAPAARVAGLAGPFPADTVFVRALRGEFDAVIAPYHDVGMTAIKVASFGQAVNVTLGLPFPRTSPDHGTALDIAGRGMADPSSFVAATLSCARIAARLAGVVRPVSAAVSGEQH